MKPAGLVLLGSCALGIAGCEKDNPTAGVPLVPVDITINVNNPAYVDLQVPGGWLYLTGGVQGILVYRNTSDAFTAMDRQCTFQPATGCRVVVDESQVAATDTSCCGASYLLLDGSVTQGPATLALARYNTSFNGSILRIYN
jgi:nitrite reductase/ring-hydroxylating ferredoxin subunit